MKDHLVAAMREILDRWEALLVSMDEGQITAPRMPSHWSIKDDIAHLMAWQLRSSARFRAALINQEPVYPDWLSNDDLESEYDTDQINARIYKTYADLTWSEVHQNWRDGFRRLLDLAEQISEKDLLDTDKYPWLKGYSLAFILVASYDHHQEHLEKLRAWLHEQGKLNSTDGDAQSQ